MLNFSKTYLANAESHIVNNIYAELHGPASYFNQLKHFEINAKVQDAITQAGKGMDDLFYAELYRIDRIEITLTLGINELDNLARHISAQMLVQLEDLKNEKNSLVGRGGSWITSRRADPGMENEHSRLPIISEDEPLDVLLYFLDSGRLPWHATSSSLDLRLIQGKLWQRLLLSLRDSPKRLRRFVHHFGIKEILFLFESNGEKSFSRALEKWTKEIGIYVDRSSKRYDASYRAKVEFLHLVIARRCGQSRSGETQFDEYLGEVWAEYKLRIGRLASPITELERHLDRKFFSGVAILERTSELVRPESKRDLDVEGRPTNSLEDKTDLEITRQEKNDNWNHCGLILLHPFFPSLFKNLGLLENGKFVDYENRERAACLLFYLATGSDRFVEFEMSFCKYLCGLKNEDPIPMELPLSDYEKEEADRLLASVIGHWGALKNTSLEGLRVNFIQREGCLISDATAMTLHIDSQAFDVLLDQLPWSISIVKLPWLEEILTIKWR